MAVLSKSEVLKKIRKDHRSVNRKVYETLIIYFGTVRLTYWLRALAV